MHIKSLIRTSLIDYPGKLAAVIFTSGCNFRCPFCQNAQLVQHPDTMPDIAVEEVLSSLAERRSFIDGVVVSGGEPTLQADLPDLLRQIKALGLAVKLDTNGYRPDVLRLCLADGLVDFVAMDIKATRRKYPLAAGIPLKLALIEESIALLLSSETEVNQSVQYELRTTVVPGIVDPQDVDEICVMIQGAKRYMLQQFRPEGALDVEWQKVKPYPAATLMTMAERLVERGIPTEVRSDSPHPSLSRTGRGAFSPPP